MLAYHFCMVSNNDLRRSWYPDIVESRMGSRGFLQRPRPDGDHDPNGLSMMPGTRHNVEECASRCRESRREADPTVRMRAIILIMGTYEY